MEAYITADLYSFFRDLAENNNRDWFLANRARFEAQVQEPLLDFIGAFRIRLHSISPHFRADARRSGGSLFRIYRDTRFSSDKTPYKTHAGIQFRHEKGKDAHAPGFYLHLQPDESFLAMGLWQPDGPNLLKVRKAIAERPDEWLAIIKEPTFSSLFELAGDALKRPPKGFDADHPLIEDLKRKDFVIYRNLSEKETLAPDFIDHFAQTCRLGSEFMRFLTLSLGLPF